MIEVLFKQLLILSEQAEKHRKFLNPETQMQIASEMRQLTERIESLRLSSIDRAINSNVKK